MTAILDRLSPRTKSQIARFLRVFVLVLVPSLVALHGPVDAKVAVGLCVAALEAAWRQVAPAIPLYKSTLVPAITCSWSPEQRIAGQRLGRHLEHDERSRAFPAPRSAGPLHSVLHVHHGAVLDQGQLGSCTGNGATQNLMTEPLWHGGLRLTETTAKRIYELATHLDLVPGFYPPTDTGSSGLAAAKAAKQLGFCSSYSHAFGIDHALSSLMLGPVMFGTNWYEGMDAPDAAGLVHVSGQIRGGHEYTGIGFDIAADEIICLNSWGKGWGAGGTFRISRTDMARLLDESGDVTVLKV